MAQVNGEAGRGHLRVLLVTETFVPSVDGVVTRLTHLVEHLIAEGHEVEIIAPGLGVDEYEVASDPDNKHQSKRAPVHGARTVRVPFYPSRPWSPPTPSTYRLTERVVRDFRPDVIHAAQPILLGQAAVRAARRHRIPLVASYHTNLPAYLSRYRAWAWSAPIITWATRRLHREATFNVVTSEAMREQARTMGLERVEVVRRAVDTQLFHPGKGPTPAPPHDSHNRRLRLLFVGRLAAEKDLSRLAPLMRCRDDLELTLVGEGPHRADLEREFRGTRTRFTGVLQGEELARAYRAHDLFVFPSVTETLGLVLLEAMASGLPPLAARSGPTLEQIVDGETGFVFRDQHELERILDTLMGESGAALRARVGESARREAERHTWAAASEDFVSLYRRAIESAEARIRSWPRK
ncbi:glycosyltransferase family 1 protein [Dermabacter sp. p3-SID358]|uniref:glycosyltransferase family 4 protein n=1 Tax=Dermabacter sp. p3-SID358 TaxID=2916114 RepID=UPI0021A91E12|nr:glycosyltransferase family 1 protein [Dermabacter sp. p3-SID358]MCT1866881.1 glycosyltransferase family 1 protein [Dermabacter sp. p3-SID358]